jgi:hypothetical protein
LEHGEVRSLYGASSLKAVESELAKYKLVLVEVQEVRWGTGDSRQTIIHLSTETGILVIPEGQAFSYIRKSYQ